MQAVYQAHDEIRGGKDLRRFEEVFPTNFDVLSYMNRIARDPRVAGAYLEQVVGLRDWATVHQG